MAEQLKKDTSKIELRSDVLSDILPDAVAAPGLELIPVVQEVASAGNSAVNATQPDLFFLAQENRFSFALSWFLFSLPMLTFYLSGLPSLLLTELFKHLNIAAKIGMIGVSYDYIFRTIYLYVCAVPVLVLSLIMLSSLFVFLYQSFDRRRRRCLEFSSAGIRDLSRFGDVNEIWLPGLESLVKFFVRFFCGNLAEGEIDYITRVERLGAFPAKEPVTWESIVLANLSLDASGREFLSLEIRSPRAPATLTLTTVIEGLDSKQRRKLKEELHRYIPQSKWSSVTNKRKTKKKRHWGYTDIWFAGDSLRRCRSDYLPDGTQLQHGSIDVGAPIGGGGLANVYHAIRHLPDGASESIVLKEFIHVADEHEMESESKIGFENEKKVLEKLHHSRVVKLKEAFSEDHRSYLILEYIEGISLQELVRQKGKLSETEVIDIALQLCDVLSYLHSLAVPVIHRDFTPHNMLLQSDGRVKVIDFNAAIHEYRKQGVVDEVVGKPAYVPPEQFRGKAVVESDIYALGATIYYLLTADEPEPISCSSPKSKCSELSDEIDAIVRKATQINAGERYADVDLFWADLLILKSENDESKNEPDSI